MEEFTDAHELAEAVRTRVGGSRRRLIAIDGTYGSGKTTLAEALAASLGAATVKLDRYVQKNGRPYREQLRYEEIQRDVEAARMAATPVIVEGVCLLHVLEQVKLKADVLVYVKKLDESGLWHDQDTCDPAFINLQSPLLKLPGAALAREVAAYHLERDPLGKVDFIFVRIKKSSPEI